MAPFFIALISIVIIVLLLSVNLSKVSFLKVRTDNATDAGALAGASQMAFAFNQLALQDMSMYFSYMSYYLAIQELNDKANEYLNNAIEAYVAGLALIGIAIIVACTPYVGKWLYMALLIVGEIMIAIALKYFNMYIAAMNEMKPIIKNMYTTQKKAYKGIRTSMSENTASARDIAHDYAFLNSGISGKLNDKLDIEGNPVNAGAFSQVDAFSSFIQGKNTPDTFSWTDGSGRQHTVNVTVNKPTPTTYQLIDTNKDWGYINDKFDELFLKEAIISALIIAVTAAVLYGIHVVRASSACEGWVITIPYGGCVVPGECFAGIVLAEGMITLAIGGSIFYIFHTLTNGIWDAVQEDGTFYNSDGDIGKKILVTVADITDSRRIGVNTNQEHEGKDLGLWQARYPEIKSDSTAAYNCDKSLCEVHSGSCVNGEVGCLGHQPQLISAH